MQHFVKLCAVIVAVTGTLFADTVFAQLGSVDKDLVYTPVVPCRILNTQTVGGALAPNTARGVDVTAVSDYSFQGGEAGNCGGVGGAGSFAAVAAIITVINPNASGTLKTYAFGTTAPANAITLAYAAGEVRSNTAIIKIDQGASANELSLLSSAQTHVTIDVVGYFRAPLFTPALQCQDTADATVSVSAGATANAVAPACASGYTQTATNCESSTWQMPFVYFSGGTCSAQNNSSGTAYLRASRTCCRVQLAS